MGFWIKSLAIFLIAAPLSAMFAEPFFEAVLDHLGVKTENWAVPVVTAMFDIFAREWFIYGSLASIGVGIGIWLNRSALRYDRKKAEAALASTDADQPEETPLKEVAALIFSKINGGTPSAFLSVYADNPKDQIRGIADLITMWYPVIGRFPGTQTKQVIKPGTYFTCYDSDGAFAATANPPTNTVQFERLSIPAKDAGRISTELISRLEGMM